MMRVYLDTSVYNRLYDDQSQALIYLETQAVLIILNLIESKQIESVNSSVLMYENKKNRSTKVTQTYSEVGKYSHS